MWSFLQDSRGGQHTPLVDGWCVGAQQAGPLPQLQSQTRPKPTFTCALRVLGCALGVLGLHSELSCNALECCNNISRLVPLVDRIIS